MLRTPTEQLFDFHTVDSVAQVVSWTIWNMLDQRLIDLGIDACACG
jgi:hypothetical protein